MTNKLITSSVSGRVPLAAHLKPGQVAINTADAEMFVNNGAEVIPVGSSSKSGLSKAQYFELSKIAKLTDPFNGFHNMGNHLTGSAYVPVNTGLWSNTLSSNVFRIGRSGGEGGSETDYSVAMLEGSTIRLESGTSESQLNIDLPPACDGKKTYDSATGAVVEHASAAEAFEGLINDGDFRSGVTTNYTYIDSTPSIVDGNLEVTYTAHTQYVNTTIATEAGKEYTFRVTLMSSASKTAFSIGRWNAVFGSGDFVTNVFDVVGGEVITKELTFVATGTLVTLTVFTAMTVGTEKVTVYSMECRASTESVITSRQDFGFLEVFYRRVSKDGGADGYIDAVFPLGNTGWTAATWEGITLGDNTPQGYSAAGSWDTALQGKSFVWSTATSAQKALYRNHPDCKSYLDDDGYVIVRDYRIRVVEGLGNDWGYVEPAGAGNKSLSYSDASPVVRVTPQGSLTSSPVELANAANGDFLVSESGATSPAVVATKNSKGMWGARLLGASANAAHEGMCYAIPLFLVQRGNIAMYHPEHNPEGYTLHGRNDASTNGELWHAAVAYDTTSTSQAFDPARKATKAGEDGNIGGVSGRPDGEFYDAIYARNVKDLRMSSRKKSKIDLQKELRDDSISGEVRGFEGVPFTKVVASTVGGTVGVTSALTFGASVNGVVVGSSVSFYDGDGNLFTSKVATVINSGLTVTFLPTSPRGFQGNTLVVLEFVSTYESANPGWTGIVGTPANILATFPNGVQGKWLGDNIGTGTNGTGANMTSSKFAAGRKFELPDTSVYTLDGGVTWTTLVNRVNGSLGISNIIGVASHYGENSLSYDFEDNELAVVKTIDDNGVAIINFKTQSHFTEDSANQISLTAPEYVWAGGPAYTNAGNLLVSSLIGRVGVTASSSRHSLYTSLKDFYIDAPTGRLYSDTNYLNRHEAINLGGTGPAAKVMDTLTEADGVFELQLHWSEMMYDSSGYPFQDGTVSFTYVNGTIYRIGSPALNVIVKSVIGGTITFTTDMYEGNNGWYTSAGALAFVTVNINNWGDDGEISIPTVTGSETFTDDNGQTGLRGTSKIKSIYFSWED